MSKKGSIILIFIAAVMLFSACSRSASPLVLPAPTSMGAISSSVPNAQSTPTTTNYITLPQTWGTTTAAYVQTAVAMGTFTAVPPSETPQPMATNTQAPATVTSILPGTGVPTVTLMPGTTPITTPITTPAIVVPTATPGRPATYTLHEGEFPYCLARRFNVNQYDIMTLNGFVDGQLYKDGQLVKIPQTGSFVGSRAYHPHPVQYTVKVDDSLYSIACYFGDVDPSSIAAANGLTLASKPVTGTILNIP
jgi:LysM repeat protein